MISTKAIRPLCYSCKLDLYNLFAGGLSNQAKPIRPSRTRSQLFRNPSRAFRVAAVRRNQQTAAESQAQTDLPAPSPTHQDNEDAARKARNAFGHTLPANHLSPAEYQVYERLYGAPLRESTGEDIRKLQGDLHGEALAEPDEEGDLTIYRQTKAGDFEAVEEEFDEEEDEELNEEYEEDEEGEDGDMLSAEDAQSLKAREALRLDMIAAERQHYIETGEITKEDGSEVFGPRTHPYTKAARWGTEPFSITMPRRTFVDPITEILKTASRKQLVEVAQRTFGGHRLQDSVATPVKAKAEHFQQKPVALEAVQVHMGEMEANAFVAVNMPGTYASAMSILVECRRRLGSTWLEGLMTKEGGPRILDAGAAGAGVLAWQDILRAEWARLHPEVKSGDPVPFGRATVVTGSSELRSRVRLLLDNTTFIPRMPEFIPMRDLPGGPGHDPSLRKQYDVIIASHSLWTLKEDYMRKAQVQNYFTLLNPNGGVLIILEKGVPRGFELVAGAREVLLKHHISSPGESEQINELSGIRTHKEPGMIIAPCTNHGQCPMYPESGPMTHRKDWCSFSQRFVRPPFLQDILGKSHRNHEDIQFSYVAVRRGVDTRPEGQAITDEALTVAAHKGYEKSETQPNALSLPRLLLPPLKRHKHVVMDVCTPAGKIERWTTSFSFSRQSYRDGRKAKWGDLWALGAKVRVIRQARTGTLKLKGKGRRTGSAKTPSSREDGKFQTIDQNVAPDDGRDRARQEKRVKTKRRRELADQVDSSGM